MVFQNLLPRPTASHSPRLRRWKWTRRLLHGREENLQLIECSFFGNVTLGSSVTLPELRQPYDVVVLAYGAESDRVLGIPGEVASISEDLKQGIVSSSSNSGKEGLLQLLGNRNVRVVPFNRWEKIDSRERELGFLRDKPREKLATLQELEEASE